MRENLLMRVQHQHLGIAAIAKNVTGEDLLRRPAPCKWHIKDNIAHIAAYQLLFTERMQKTIAGEHLQFGGYIPEQDSRFLEMQQWPLEQLLQSLLAGGNAMHDLFTAAEPAALANIATHAKYGSMDVQTWVEFYLLHEAHHMFTIFKLAKKII